MPFAMMAMGKNTQNIQYPMMSGSLLGGTVGNGIKKSTQYTNSILKFRQSKNILHNQAVAEFTKN
jgi:hypothetical protein